MTSLWRRVQRWCCDALDWHSPNDHTWSDGCSARSTCRVCGRALAMDSSGAWFAIGERHTRGVCDD